MADLSSLGADTCGVWTRRSALHLLTRAELRTLLSTSWQTVWPGVYADAGVVLDPTQRAFAAVLVSGGEGQGEPVKGSKRRRPLRAIASGRTAARVWGFPLIDDDDPATGACEQLIDDVALWRHLAMVRIADSDGRVRELRRHQPSFRDGDVVQLSSGLWITSAVRTLIDLATLLTPEAAVCALDDALHREVVCDADLQAACDRRRRRAGARRLCDAVALADGRAEAPSETLARLLLKPHLPGLEPQYRLLDGSERLVARFDLGDPALGLAVEADGRVGHAGDAMVAKDRRRDRRSEGFGWTTERVTWFELRREQEQFVRRVVATAVELRNRPRPA